MTEQELKVQQRKEVQQEESTKDQKTFVPAVDIFETDTGFSVNEVNYTMEFRNSIDTTGINIPEKVVDYILEVGRK